MRCKWTVAFFTCLTTAAVFVFNAVLRRKRQKKDDEAPEADQQALLGTGFHSSSSVVNISSTEGGDSQSETNGGGAMTDGVSSLTASEPKKASGSAAAAGTAGASAAVAGAGAGAASMPAPAPAAAAAAAFPPPAVAPAAASTPPAAESAPPPPASAPPASAPPAPEPPPAVAAPPVSVRAAAAFLPPAVAASAPAVSPAAASTPPPPAPAPVSVRAAAAFIPPAVAASAPAVSPAAASTPPPPAPAPVSVGAAAAFIPPAVAASAPAVSPAATPTPPPPPPAPVSVRAAAAFIPPAVADSAPAVSPAATSTPPPPAPVAAVAFIPPAVAASAPAVSPAATPTPPPPPPPPPPVSVRAAAAFIPPAVAASTPAVSPAATSTPPPPAPVAAAAFISPAVAASAPAVSPAATPAPPPPPPPPPPVSVPAAAVFIPPAVAASAPAVSPAAASTLPAAAAAAAFKPPAVAASAPAVSPAAASTPSPAAYIPPAVAASAPPASAPPATASAPPAAVAAPAEAEAVAAAAPSAAATPPGVVAAPAPAPAVSTAASAPAAAGAAPAVSAPAATASAPPAVAASAPASAPRASPAADSVPRIETKPMQQPTPASSRAIDKEEVNEVLNVADAYGAAAAAALADAEEQSDIDLPMRSSSRSVSHPQSLRTSVTMKSKSSDEIAEIMSAEIPTTSPDNIILGTTSGGPSSTPHSNVQQPGALRGVSEEETMQWDQSELGVHPLNQRMERKGGIVPSPPSDLVATHGGAKRKLPQASTGPQEDFSYLQDLIDSNLGPPKFAQPKVAATKAEGGKKPHLPATSSLQKLLDKEFGPPKFAVPKTVSDSSASSATTSATTSATKSCKPFLRLEVIAGPSAGLIFESAETMAKLVIGRYPDCTFNLADQEVSGRHATFSFHRETQSWKVADMGSLNGTVLNTEVISFEDRRVGESHVLHSDAVMELGSVTQIQVKCAPTPDTSNPKRARVGSTTNQVYAPSRLDSLPTKTGASATPRVQLPPHVDIATLSAMSLHIAVHQRIGADHQRINTPTEDVVLWDGHFTPFPSSGLFCVFDGHQGPNAAALAKKILPEVLRSTFAQSTEDAGGDRSTSSTPGGLVTGLPEAVQRKCLTKVFLETDEKMAADEGCTATALLVERTAEGGLAMQSANVGDSSVLLVNVSSKKWEKLTQDHRISTSASERARLEKRGHFVKSRLYGLNISRMLGDKFLKDEDLGFLAEPYISAPARVPPGEACFIVLASDGLWDVITEQRASALVIKAYEEDPGLTAAALADIMLEQAITHRSRDDISVVVLKSLA